MNKVEVGARIKAYMKENKITQEEIAAKMGVGQSYVSGMVNGQRDTLRLAEALSENYGVNLDWLIYGNNKHNEQEHQTQSNIITDKMKYYERAMDLVNKYIDNERRYQEIMKENQEILKQFAAIQQLMKE